MFNDKNEFYEWYTVSLIFSHFKNEIQNWKSCRIVNNVKLDEVNSAKEI
jgi:hypothetical protein